MKKLTSPLKQNLPLDADHVEEKLISLFNENKWQSSRVWFRKVQERNQFISANIIVILKRSHVKSNDLYQAIHDTQSGLSIYQKEHQTYHWPITNGKSFPDNAPLLNVFNLLNLDADADCTALQQLAQENIANINPILDDLSFYRLDAERFQLPLFQRKVLPNALGTYLVWFPTRDKCVNHKIEQLDIVVQANILWMLNEAMKKGVIGFDLTVDFIQQVIDSGLIVKNPYAVSPYYPYPIVIIYALSRAIVWGKIETLQHSRNKLLSLARMCPLNNDLERLCLISIGKLWGDDELQLSIPIERFRDMNTGAFYAATNASSLFGWLSNKSWTRFEFHSEALQWAMLHWLFSD